MKLLLSLIVFSFAACSAPEPSMQFTSPSPVASPTPQPTPIPEDDVIKDPVQEPEVSSRAPIKKKKKSKKAHIKIIDDSDKAS